MNIDTNTLRCFVAVAETGSYTQAGLIVGRTQSAISQKMSQLEAYIGKPLFEKGKRISLTHEGKLLIEYAKKSLKLQREALEHIRCPEMSGEVRFGMPENFASIYLSDILLEFSNIHPRIFISVECDLTLNLYDKFIKNKLDLVLVKMMNTTIISDTVEVYSDSLEWAGNPSAIKDHQGIIPLVLSPEPCVYRASAIKSLIDAGLNWRITFSSPSYTSTLAAVEAGLGITVLSRRMRPGHIMALNDAFLPKLNDTHIGILRKKTVNPALDSFQSFVIEKLKNSI